MRFISNHIISMKACKLISKFILLLNEFKYIEVRLFTMSLQLDYNLELSSNVEGVRDIDHDHINMFFCNYTLMITDND